MLTLLYAPGANSVRHAPPRTILGHPGPYWASPRRRQALAEPNRAALTPQLLSRRRTPHAARRRQTRNRSTTETARLPHTETWPPRAPRTMMSPDADRRAVSHLAACRNHGQLDPLPPRSPDPDLAPAASRQAAGGLALIPAYPRPALLQPRCARSEAFHALRLRYGKTINMLQSPRDTTIQIQFSGEERPWCFSPTSV